MMLSILNLLQIFLAKLKKKRFEHDVSVAYRPSDVLLLESLEICLQERWMQFARYLMAARLVDVRTALRCSLKLQARTQGIPLVRLKIQDALDKLRELTRALRSSLGGQARRRALATDDDTSDAMKVLQNEANIRDSASQLVSHINRLLSDLPEPIASEIDERLCQRHQKRMVRGQYATHRLSLNHRLHPQATLGLAISGGGIRSASIAIGALQALARWRLLLAFQYVSSVSGGGYAASWYLTWAYRHKKGLEGVAQELDSTLNVADSGPLWWVRRHCSYLAPRMTLSTSGDVASLITAYIINWIPVFLLIAAAMIAILLIPHNMVLVSKVSRRLPLEAPTQLWIVGLLIILVVVIYIGVLRRLLMYYREPTQPPRDPIGLTVGFIVITLGVAVTVASTASILTSLFTGNSPVEITVQLAAKVWLGWIAIYGGALVLAIGLATETSQLAIDKVRGRFASQTMFRGELRRIPVPWWLVIVGTSVQAAFCTFAVFSLLTMVTPTDNSPREAAVYGPFLTLSIFACSEMTNAILGHHFMRDADRAWSARVGSWLFTALIVCAVLTIISLKSDEAIVAWKLSPYFMQIILSLLGGVCLVFAWRFRLYNILYFFVVALFAIYLSIAIVNPLLQYWTEHLGHSEFFLLLIAVVSTIGLGLLINVNRFSLHALYREGLVRTFLGASRLSSRNNSVDTDTNKPPREVEQFRARRPDPITNIDEEDNPALVWIRSQEKKILPVFLLNAAVNGLSITDMAGRVPRQWPYTFSPHFCGSPVPGVGYCRADEVFRRDRTRPLSLGTAMAVSGAAVSPNGGNNNPMKAFVCGLLNARLGLWVRNPSRPSREGPWLTGLAIFREILGIHLRFGRWIHLSDGGHFENLGIYELLRRGCSRIVVIDGSCDPESRMTDLAHAIRRARIDLGIVIRNPKETDFSANEEISASASQRRRLWGDRSTTSDDLEPTRSKDRSWRWFTIEYGALQPLGRLLYIKPFLTDRDNLPVEIRNYSMSSPTFPHETTADQFFSEEQLEAYRSLGELCGNEAMEAVMKIKNSARRSFDQGLVDQLLRTKLRDVRRMPEA